jgi:hypothetical protein
MKLDAHAIVDEQNNTLLVRGAYYPLTACAKDIRALRAELRVPLYLLRSYVDKAGKEVLAEFCEPLACAALEQNDHVKGARVEVWHKTMPPFDEGYEKPPLKADYRLAAVFLVPHDSDKDKLLDGVYCLSQNIDTTWNPITHARSTSAGDVLVVQVADEADQAYRIAPRFGFTPVAFN